MILSKAINYILSAVDQLFSSPSTVLTYHSVSDGATPISVTTESFRKQMKFLVESGRSVISLREYFDGKSGVLITFDDAFKDVYQNALPILKENNFPAVIFVNTSLLGGHATFATLDKDRSRQICTLEDLRQLADSKFAIANHGNDHRQLSGLADDEVISEYEKAFSFIKKSFIKNSYPDVFVFPKGAKNESVKVLLRSKGAKILDDRIDIYSDTSMAGFALKLSRSYLWLRDKLSSLKKHWSIFMLAFAISLLIVAPTISAIWQIGPDFRGIYPMLSNDEDQYLSMTREAYDGHYNFGSVYLKEHKDAPYLQQPLAGIIFEKTARLFDISIPKLFAVNDFLLPFVGVLLLYSLFFSLTEVKNISVLFSGLYYLIFISAFNRPINPQFSFLFLFLGLLLIWKIVNNEKRDTKIVLLYNLLLAIDFGIAFYIYPFVWSAIFVVYCLMLFVLVIKEGYLLYYIKNFLAFAIPAGLFATPFILNMQLASADPNYMDQNLRFGFLFNHWPGAYVNVAIMSLSLIVIFLSGKITNQKQKIFAYVLAISGILLNWQNVITGKAFSFSMHYYWVVTLFMLIIFAICLRSKRWPAIVLMFFMIIGLSYREMGGIKFGLGFADQLNISNFRQMQEFVTVADWFDKNSPRDSAIYPLGKNYNHLIPIYTYNNNFANANAGLFLISDDEMENRFVIQNFFTEGIDVEYIKHHNVEIWTNKFIERYQSESNRKKIISFITRQPRKEVEFIPKEYIDRILAKVDSYQKLGFEQSLKQYAVDYILLDKNDPGYGRLVDNFKKMPFLSLVAEIDSSLIFKVAK
ncbi:MAG: polysaccharide deacetylase family protein [bacterium]|nr:polysaccharide deacetylase family protein [bacterium]